MSDDVKSCPKCGHTQSGGKECESCGVIFARYKTVVRRRQEFQQQQAKEKKQRSGQVKMLLLLLFLVAITAGTTYYLVRPAAAPEQVAVQQGQDIPPAAEIDLPEDAAPVKVAAGRGGDEPEVSHGGSIEQARKATVSIETPWGTGSGFFITQNFIVTNKHVVEVDLSQLEEFRRQVEAGRKVIELEQEKIRNWKKDLSRMPKGPSREQLKIIIAERERELAKVLPKYEEAEQRLTQMETPITAGQIKVILADGSEHSANFLLNSNDYDLALLSITVADHPVLKRAPDSYRIRQGDKVYTIGSPVGLRNTVTAGIFSGYRKNSETGRVLLQTDAPINPGNSGGPLIDEKGFVRGVNTMIIKDTEGIGFAIPIEKVFEDFGASLY